MLIDEQGSHHDAASLAAEAQESEQWVPSLRSMGTMGKVCLHHNGLHHIFSTSAPVLATESWKGFCILRHQVDAANSHRAQAQARNHNARTGSEVDVLATLAWMSVTSCLTPSSVLLMRSTAGRDTLSRPREGSHNLDQELWQAAEQATSGPHTCCSMLSTARGKAFDVFIQGCLQASCLSTRVHDGPVQAWCSADIWSDVANHTAQRDAAFAATTCRAVHCSMSSRRCAKSASNCEWSASSSVQ